jgi:anti-anti-sigma regulatory factor
MRLAREGTMLRITIHKSLGTVTFQLEGRLAGPWVQELAACWRAMLDQSSAPVVRVDLVAVTFVDGAGRELLTAMHHRGAKLVAADCLMNAVVAEISRSQGSGIRGQGP